MRTKKLMAITILAIAAYGLLAHAFNPQDAVADANDFLKTVVDRSELSQATKGDVSLAKSNLYQAQLEAGKIAVSEFCKLALPEAKSYVESTDDQLQAGEVSTEQAIRARKTYFAIKKQCP